MHWKIHPCFQLSRRWQPEVSLGHVPTSLETPNNEVVQANGRIRRWSYVEEPRHHVRVAVLKEALISLGSGKCLATKPEKSST